jgi:hypothetical protein
MVPLTTDMLAFRVARLGMANFGTNTLLTVLPLVSSALPQKSEFVHHP